MSVEINPIPLFGSWDLGFALDTHVIESIPLGEDADGPGGNLRFLASAAPQVAAHRSNRTEL